MWQHQRSGYSKNVLNDASMIRVNSLVTWLKRDNVLLMVNDTCWLKLDRNNVTHQQLDHVTWGVRPPILPEGIEIMYQTSCRQQDDRWQFFFFTNYMLYSIFFLFLANIQGPQLVAATVRCPCHPTPGTMILLIQMVCKHIFLPLYRGRGPDHYSYSIWCIHPGASQLQNLWEVCWCRASNVSQSCLWTPWDKKAQALFSSSP